MEKRTKKDARPARTAGSNVYDFTIAEMLEEYREMKWYWVVGEVEVEEHEGCLGPECVCVKERNE